MNLLASITSSVLVTYIMSLFLTMSVSLFLTITASLVAGDYLALYLLRLSTARHNIRNRQLRLK